MNLLTRIHWRQVRVVPICLTLLGMVMAAMFQRISFTDWPPRAVLGLAFLAAWLGGRLFHFETIGPTGVYLRTLPFSAAQRFKTKLIVAAVVLACSFVVQALFWYSDLPRTIAGPTPSAYFVPPTASELVYPLSWVLLVFAITAWLANSLEMKASAIQAGFVGLALSYPLLDYAENCGVESSSGKTAFNLGLIGFLLWAAFRAYRLKGVDASTWSERVLKSPSKVDLLAWIPASLLLLAIPIGFGVSSSVSEQFGKYFSFGAVGISLLYALAFGVLLLPWTVRQVRARGMQPWRALGTILLSLTGWGILVWWGARRRGPMGRCAKCSRRRLTSLEHCPKCTATKVISIEGPPESESALFEFLGGNIWTPFNFIGLYLLASSGPQGTFGFFRGITTYDIQLSEQSPLSAKLFINGEKSTEPLIGITLGRSYGFGFDPLSFSSSQPAYFQIPNDEVSTSDIIHGIDKGADQVIGSPSPRVLQASYKAVFERAFQSPLALSARNEHTSNRLDISGINVDVEYGPLKHHVTLSVIAHDAKQTLLIQRFKDRTQSNRPLLEDEVAEWLSHGDLFLAELYSSLPKLETALRAKTVRSISRTISAIRKQRRNQMFALTQLVLARFDADSEPSAASVLESLDQQLLKYRRAHPNSDQLSSLIKLGRPWLEALALPARRDPTCLIPLIREGSLPALIAAGLSAEPALFELCLEQFEHSLKDTDARQSAGWALLAIDPKRGISVLAQRLHSRAETSLVRLLAFSDNSNMARFALKKQLIEDPYVLARDLGESHRWDIDMYRYNVELALWRLNSGFQPEDYLDELMRVDSAQ